MKTKKYKVSVVFGSDATREYWNGGASVKKMKELGSVVKRSFDTEEELNAYKLGLEDYDGYLEYAVME